MSHDEAIVSLQEFLDNLAVALDLDGSTWSGAALIDQVGLDSLDMYEALCTIEQWADCEFDDELVVSWRTFDDLYRCYINNSRGPL